MNTLNSHTRYNFQDISTFSPPVGSHDIPRYLDKASKVPNSDLFHATSNNNMSSSFKSSGRTKLLMNDATIYCTNPDYEEDHIINDCSTNSLNSSNSFVSSAFLEKSSRLIKRPHARGSSYEKPWILDEKLRYYGRPPPKPQQTPEERKQEINAIRNLPSY